MLRKRDGRRECHRMNFPLFVSFPTKQRHQSAATAHAGWVGARFGGGAGVRDGGHLNIKNKSYLLCQVCLGVAVNEP
jgi:hypothetical protein